MSTTTPTVLTGHTLMRHTQRYTLLVNIAEMKFEDFCRVAALDPKADFSKSVYDGAVSAAKSLALVGSTVFAVIMEELENRRVEQLTKELGF